MSKRSAKKVAASVEVLTLGECMALAFPPQPVGLEKSTSLRLDIAGAESNLCIGLSRLGIRARFISRVGDDPFGRRIRMVLDREGVDIGALRSDPNAPTGVFFREHLPDGQRRVYYYRQGSAASHLSPDDLRPELFQNIRLVHLTGITPALSQACAAACSKAIDLARQAGARVSFDPNYRPQLWKQPTEAQATLLPLICQTDILLMGHEDAAALFDDPSITEVSLDRSRAEKLLRNIASLGVGLIVLKLGESGACALAEGRFTGIPAQRVAKVVDPVGAGDGFDAGFLAGWLRGYPTEKCLELGARLGAAAVSVMGDYQAYPNSIIENEKP